MKVDAMIYGYNLKNKAGYGVDLSSGEYKHDRLIPLRAGTSNQAELHALEYVLSAVEKPETVELDIITCNPYIVRIVQRGEDGKYVVSPEKNVALVEAIRNKTGKWAKVVVRNDEKPEAFKNLQDKVRTFVQGI